MCPLLVQTPSGLRCSAQTADVRPFWGRFFGYYGGVLAALYLSGAIGIFAVLRTVGYPVSIVHVTWPGLWYRVPQARGWFFMQKAQRSMSAGRTSEGLLYLSNAYQFDPGNYQIGLALAKVYQSGRPNEADALFERLLRQHPAQRDATAQEWFRTLLARGDFQKISLLAYNETLVDPSHGHVWIRAVLFATRQLGDNTCLHSLLANTSAAAAVWHQLLETELLVRAGRLREARAAFDRPWPMNGSPFTIYYRVNTLAALGDAYAALDTLEANRNPLSGDDYASLKLETLATAGASRMLRAKLDELLLPTLTPATTMVLCAHLIRHPDGAVFTHLADKMQQEQPPLTASTAGVWFSLYCTAGAVGDTARLHALTLTLKLAANAPFFALSALEAFFRHETGPQKITAFLPAIPLPLEINYALIERYSPPPRARATPPATKP